MTKFLIINPNSSVSVTQNLKSLLPVPPNVQLDFYTAPKVAPLEIDGYDTSIASAEIVYPEIVRDHLKNYDAFLVCCYSDHPLINELRKVTDKPILGIFQATITYALTQSPAKFGILTSTRSWEAILDKAVFDFFGGADVPLFTGTVASNVNVTKLGDDEYFQQVVDKAKILAERGSKIIILGCAGLSGLESKLKAAIPGVQFVDSVKIGTELLNTIVRFSAAQ